MQKTDYIERADALVRRIHDRSWKIAASVEIPRNGCCLHNASIDDNQTGWCAGPNGRERLRTAKRVVAMQNEAWKLSRLGENLWRKAHNRTHPTWAQYDLGQVEPINVHLLFAV